LGRQWAPPQAGLHDGKTPGSITAGPFHGQLRITGGFCAPDPIIKTAGNYKPPTCVSFAGVPQSEGRCTSPCLPAVAQNPSLETSSCGNGDKCAPCYNPFSGATTGACAISSCDAPASPPYTFPNCCFDGSTPGGRCVPKSQVKPEQQGSLSQDSCSNNNYLCAPNEFLPPPNNTPGQACHVAVSFLPPFFNWDGTCINSCANLGIGQGYPQANCPSHHKCIPCGNAPAHSPGCP